MKNTWKWILGIIIVLLVIASILYGHMNIQKKVVGVRNEVSTFRTFHVNPPLQMDGQNFRFDDHRGVRTGYDFVYPMIRQRSSFFRGLFPLVILSLLVYGAYNLGTRKNEKSSNSGAQEVIEPELVDPDDDVSELSCSKCGGVIQAGWRNCPHCGKRV